MWSQRIKTHREVSRCLLTCCLVDVQTALSLSALEVPGETLDGVEWASVQARDGQIGAGGVVLQVGVWAELVYGQGVLDSLSNRGPGYSDAVIAGRGGGELRRRQNCGGEEGLWDVLRDGDCSSPLVNSYCMVVVKVLITNKHWLKVTSLLGKCIQRSLLVYLRPSHFTAWGS